MFRGHLIVFDSEQLMLNQLRHDINFINPDFIVGHEINNILDLLYARMTENQIDSIDQVSRLKRSPRYVADLSRKYKQEKIDKFTQGRLVCDTFSGAKELIREVEFSLEFLAQKLLDYEINDLSSLEGSVFPSSVYEIDHIFQYNYASYLLCRKLQLIQLTKQLTNVAGCLWTQSLKGKRAERNEMLLMHKCHRKNYILPDKFRLKGDHSKLRKKMKKYKGGMVIEPESGLQSNITLLLDFNSLYPSIIRKYKLCFTTVKRTYVGRKFYTSVDGRLSEEERF